VAEQAVAEQAVAHKPQEQLRYRVLTGPDDRTFCERVSAALADGYRLHGGPAVTFNGEQVVVAQALVLADAATDDTDQGHRPNQEA
jgi:hypothetical protein